MQSSSLPNVTRVELGFVRMRQIPPPDYSDVAHKCKTELRRTKAPCQVRTPSSPMTAYSKK